MKVAAPSVQLSISSDGGGHVFPLTTAQANVAGFWAVLRKPALSTYPGGFVVSTTSARAVALTMSGATHSTALTAHRRALFHRIRMASDATRVLSICLC